METFIGLIIWLLVLGLIAYLVEIAPFLDGTFKVFIRWALIAVGVVILISFLLGYAGADPAFIR